MPQWRAADGQLRRYNDRIDSLSCSSVMVYHSQLDTTGCDFACGFPLVPVRSRGLSVAANEVSRDIVDETLYAFRANIFLRNFEVKGAADKLLIYLTLYVSLCLKRKLS